MPLSRRRFIATASFAAPVLAAWNPAVRRSDHPVVKPRRLRAGDTVGLVSPGGAIFEARDVEDVQETLAGLGLRSRVGAHALDQRGYLAGSDADRARDLNAMFADASVDAIVALRGGWGCARILPLIDYEAVRQNPKIIMGFSDVTALLVALYARTGLITFHGPVGISEWNAFSVEYVRRILIRGEALTLKNPRRVGPPLIRSLDQAQTITPGRASGRLVGGNLSVLVSLLGTDYVPDWADHILFLEDTREEVYRIDRMLTQLSLAGVLSAVRGIVFGKCTDCEPDDPDRSLSLREVFFDHFAPLGIPCWYGAMIGHTRDKFTLPVGVNVEVDAAAGSISMQEPAVVGG